MSEIESTLIISAEDGASEVLQDVGDSLKNVNETADKSDSSLKDLDKNLKKLGTSFDEIETGVSKFERGILSSFDAVANNSKASGKVIEAAFEKALDSLKSPEGVKELENSLERLKSEGKLTESQIEQLQNKIQNLGNDSKKTADDNIKLSDSLDIMGDAAESVGGESGPLGQVSAGLELIKNPAVALIGIITALATAHAKYAIESQGVNNILLKLAGSQERVNEAMEVAKGVAESLGIDVNETAKTWLSFDNALKSSGINAQLSETFFKNLSYAIVSTGGSIDDINDTIEEFREGMSDGTLNGENLEQILREKLPQAFDKSARALGITNEEFREFLNSGQDMATLIPVLNAGISGAFGDYQKVTSFNSEIGRFKNAISGLFTPDDNTTIELFTAVISKVTKEIKLLTGDVEQAQAVTTKWISVFVALFDYIQGNIGSFGELQNKIKLINDDFQADLDAINKKYFENGEAAKKSADSQTESAKLVSNAYKDIGKAIEDILKDNDKLASNLDIITSTLSEVGKKLDFSKPSESIQIFSNYIKQLATDVKLTSVEIDQGLAPAFKNISDSNLDKLLKQVNEQLEAGHLSVENYTLQTALLNEQQNRLGQSSVDLAQSQYELAQSEAETANKIADSIKLYGNQNVAIEAKVIAKEKELEVANKNVRLLVTERNEAQRILDAEIRLAGGIDYVSEAKRNEFKARQNIINIKNTEITSALQTISNLDRETKETQNLTSASQSYLKALQDIIDAEGRRLQTQSALLQSQNQRLQSEKNLAESSGDTATANQKQLEIENNLISQARTRVQVESNKLDGLHNNLTTTLNQALADGEVTESEQQKIDAIQSGIETQEDSVKSAKDALVATENGIQASKESAKTKDAEADANKNVAKTYSLMESAAERGAREVSALSAGAREMMLAGLGLVDSYQKTSSITSQALEQLRSHLAVVNSAIQWNNSIVTASTDSYDRYVRAVNNTWKAYDEQSIRAEELIVILNKMTETGRVSTTVLNEAIKGANGGFDLIDSQRLQNLQNAISKATAKVEELNEATKSAQQRLKELDAELLEAKGQTKQADLLKQQIDLDQQLAEIEKERQEALANGNQDILQYLDQQEQKLRQLNKIKIDNINAESDAQNEANKQTLESATNSSVETANRTKSAWDSVTSSIKEAKGSLQEFSNFDLTRTNNQFSDMLNILKQAKSGMR